ncbi:hypothetical protein VNO80_26910 [Phaseolus coccineus]|uniref:ATPase AAA-type core domain-containing protein n=1 Tax=Phaseolus coccineus TaxID=3886 RepID=A0AAN9QH45_PHACN
MNQTVEMGHSETVTRGALDPWRETRLCIRHHLKGRAHRNWSRGTGKTTTALAIAHQLFGPELYKSRVLELNASDDRGINVVCTKIKDFAVVAVGTNKRKKYGKSNSLKILSPSFLCL